MKIDVSKDLNSAFSVKNVNENVSNIEKQNATPKTIESDKGERDSVKEAVYGNVIGVSANGDVASAKEESLKALDDGMVFKKEEISSLVGYTENQLQEMYQKGEIDKYKYDQEVERRAKIRKEETEPNPVLEQMKKAAEKEDKEEKVNPILKDDKKKEDAKAEEVAAKKDEEKESEDKTSPLIKDDAEDVSKAKEATNTDIAKDMAKLVSDQQEQTLKANAVKDAIANDRADLIADVFGKNN